MQSEEVESVVVQVLSFVFKLNQEDRLRACSSYFNGLLIEFVII